MRKIFSRTFAPLSAQMAESVDALVSNTSGATRAGSTPALGTVKTVDDSMSFSRFFYVENAEIWDCFFNLE